MAKESEKPAEETQPPVAGKKKSKLLIIVIAALVLLGGGGGVAWFFLGNKKDADHVAEETPKKKEPPVFLTLEPFVVNLAGEAQHYLQVGIDLKLSDTSYVDQVKAYLPEIRNAVLLLLSSKQGEDLGTLEGKNQLREEIRDAINKPLGIEPAAQPGKAGDSEASAAKQQEHEEEAQPTGKAEGKPGKGAELPPEGVVEVLLTSFVIQ